MGFSMKKEKGLTLLEIMISLSILSAVTLGVVKLIDNASEDTKAAVTALHLKTVGMAGNEYIRNNYAAITGVATASTPALIRVSDLIAGGYLNAGYSLQNPRGQNTCLLVLQPTTNNLTAMVVTEAGDVIDDLTLGQIAANVGGDGGGVYSIAPDVIRGAMGGWSIDLAASPYDAFRNANHLGQHCDGSGGDIPLNTGHPMMALWFADGVSVSATLYRDAIPGNPSLNTMNTPILMGAATIQTIGDACPTNGALARTADGTLVSCVNSEWKPGGSQYWQDPVASFAALPACNAASINQTRVVETPTVGTGRRAYTCDGAGTWNALAVDNSGNITVAGTATINNLSVSGNTTIGDATSDTLIVNAGSTFNHGVTIGNGTAASASNTLVVNRTATEGAACSPNGAVARNSVGLLLSCQSGVWKKSSGEGGSSRGSTVYTDFTVNTCTSGITGGCNVKATCVGGKRRVAHQCSTGYGAYLSATTADSATCSVISGNAIATVYCR